MATAAAFFATPHNGYAALSVANTAHDGTGANIVDVITGATNGTKIERVIVQATGASTTAGMVRLWVSDGVTTYCEEEIAVTALTPSATVKAFHFEVDFSFPSKVLVLPLGHKLRASTHNAEAFHVVAIGADA